MRVAEPAALHVGSPLADSGTLPGGRQIAIVALALATAISVRSALRSWRDRPDAPQADGPASTTMEDFVDP